MKRVLVLILMFCIIFFGKSVQASGYNVLVIPASLVGSEHNHMFGKTDIEELLVRSIIWHIEDMELASAPSIPTLKISIKNNSGYNSDAVDYFNNIKAISKSYGISKVILVSTKFELQGVNEQKKIWSRLDLPVIVSTNSNLRIITKVQLLNAHNGEVLWSDVFYKNADTLGVGVNGKITGDSRLNALMAYYDTISIKVLNDIKNSKETRAIMVKSEDDKELKPLKLIKRSGVKVDIPISKKVKSNLNPIDENAKKVEPKTSKVKNVQDNIKNKVEDIKIKREQKIIRKEFSDFSELTTKNAQKNQIKNENYIETTDVDLIPANNFMHVKPRRNSRNYSPKFDSSINDI